MTYSFVTRATFQLFYVDSEKKSIRSTKCMMILYFICINYTSDSLTQPYIPQNQTCIWQKLSWKFNSARFTCEAFHSKFNINKVFIPRIFVQLGSRWLMWICFIFSRLWYKYFYFLITFSRFVRGIWLLRKKYFDFAYYILGSFRGLDHLFCNKTAETQRK